MKRSRSGTRPAAGVKVSKQPQYHAKYIYEIAFATPEGRLIGPHDEGFEEKLARLQSQCPDLYEKLSQDTLDVGLEPGSWEENCFNLLDSLMKQKRCFLFLKPVDHVAERLPDYPIVIKHPMDLGTVKTRLLGRAYADPPSFASEVRLTFDNAMQYNMATSPVHIDALKLKQQFDKKFEQIEAAHAYAGDADAQPLPASHQSSSGPIQEEPWRLTDAESAAARSAADGSAPSSSAKHDEADAADWGDFDAGDAAPVEMPKEVVSDDDDDDDDDDDEPIGGAVGGKAPKSKGPGGKGVAEAASSGMDDDEDDDELGDGKHPSTGGKAPPPPRASQGGKAPGGTTSNDDDTGAEDDDGLSDSNLGSEMGASEMQSGDEGVDEDVSEADMFGDDDDDGDGFDDDGGEEDSGFESATGGGMSSSVAEGESEAADDDEDDGGFGDPDDSVFDDEGEDEMI